MSQVLAMLAMSLSGIISFYKFGYRRSIQMEAMMNKLILYSKKSGFALCFFEPDPAFQMQMMFYQLILVKQ